jgi:hypothetical protein
MSKGYVRFGLVSGLLRRRFSDQFRSDLERRLDRVVAVPGTKETYGATESLGVTRSTDASHKCRGSCP